MMMGNYDSRFIEITYYGNGMGVKPILAEFLDSASHLQCHSIIWRISHLQK